MIRRRGARVGKIVCHQFGLVSPATENVTAGTKYLADEGEIWKNGQCIWSNERKSLIKWSINLGQGDKGALAYGPEAIFRQVRVRDLSLQVAQIHTSFSSQKRLPDEDEEDKK